MEERMCSDRMANLEAGVEQDLWEALVKAEGVSVTWQAGQPVEEVTFTVVDAPHAKVAYPWNPLTPEAEAFLDDSPSILDGLQNDEIAHRSNIFFGHIDRLWPVATLQVSLQERFAARVPHQWLVAIAQSAQQAVTSTQTAISETSTSLAEQLVQCVRDVVPGLAEEDFYVLARPLAVQMRNGGTLSAINSMVAQVPQVEWEQLSEVQRARLGLAVARFAIDELSTQSNP